MPVPLIENPDFILILTALAAIVTIIAGLIGSIRGLKGAVGKSGSLKEGLLIFGGMIIILVSFIAANPNFDLIYIYALISFFAFAPLITYRLYIAGKKYSIVILAILILGIGLWIYK